MPRRREPPLHLKIRVVLTSPMTAGTARLLVEEAVISGQVPPGIEIRWLDWKKGTGGRATSGTIETNLRAALRQFYGVVTASRTRFAKVKP